MLNQKAKLQTGQSAEGGKCGYSKMQEPQRELKEKLLPVSGSLNVQHINSTNVYL